MAPTSKKRKALALQMLPRNRTWDCEYDIYSHLQEKNKILKCGTKKFYYFNTLLQCFVVKDQKGDRELVQFMDSLHSIVKSQILHLEHPNIENTAKEKGMDDGHEDNDNGVIVDPQHKYFMDHVKPHGKSYVLDIPEDGVCVKYEPESSSPESAATYEKINVCLDIDMHVSSLENSKRNDASNRKGKHRSERMKKKSSSEILVIEDSDDAAGEIVEHCWEGYDKDKASRVFKEKVMEELKGPFCEEEYKRLLRNITVRKPVQHHRDLRGRIIIYDEDYPGKSYLDFHVDLAERIEAAHGDHPRVLNLLRGFFYWLKNLSHDGAFMPWKDPSCLDVLPQQQLEG